MTSGSVEALRQREFEDFGMIRFGGLAVANDGDRAGVVRGDVELSGEFKCKGEIGNLGVGSGDLERFGPRI